MANRSSVVDVEQILGRILRMPYAKAGDKEHLNISYAITSSADFYATLDKVVAGLVNAGFSKRDHRVAGLVSEENPFQTAMVGEQIGFDVTEQKSPESEEGANDVDDIDTHDIKSRLESMGLGKTSAEDETLGQESMSGSMEDLETQNNQSSSNNQEASRIDDMMSQASNENRMYWEAVNSTDESGNDNIPSEIVARLKAYYIRPEFREDAKQMVIPQFMRDDGITYFNESGHEFLDRIELREGFTLKDKDTMIDFGSVRAELASVDIEDKENAVPKAFRLQGSMNENMKKWFESRPSESKRRICKDIIVSRISKINAVADGEVEEYVERIMSNMTDDVLSDLEQAPELYAKKIKEKVEQLLAEHESRTFNLWLNQDRIVCEPHFRFQDKITPAKSISSIPKSLYEEEDGELNDYERDVIWELSSLDNIKWWHRNISKKGFAINGAVTAYPDIIARTETGKTLLVETKGDHLDNDESAAKAKSGAEWANAAGRMYKYFMVFQSKSPGYPGAYSHDEFMEIVKDL